MTIPSSAFLVPAHKAGTFFIEPFCSGADSFRVFRFSKGSEAAIRAFSKVTTAAGPIAELVQGQIQSAPIAAAGQKRNGSRV